jgi:hypothetical protein
MQARLILAAFVAIAGALVVANSGFSQTGSSQGQPPGTPQKPDAYLGGIPLYAPGRRAPQPAQQPTQQPNQQDNKQPDQQDAKKRAQQQAEQQAKTRAQQQALQQARLRVQQPAQQPPDPAGQQPAQQQALLQAIQQAVVSAIQGQGGGGQSGGAGQGGGGQGGGGGGPGGGAGQDGGQTMPKPNASPAPAPPADIQIVNPATYGVTRSYLIDGKPQSLPSGSAQRLNRKSVIEFDRGGNAGTIRYALAAGTYTFTYASENDRWDLVHRAGPDAGGLATAKKGVSRDPVTPAERNMFEEMYGKLDLDAATLKTLQDGWTNSTSARRKADYDQFMAKIREIEQSAAPAGAGVASPAAQAVAPPVTATEQKMFDAMYGKLNLDAGTLKILRDGWTSSTSAQRKSQYEDFMAKVKQATQAVEKKSSGSGKPPVPALPPLE